MFIKSGIKNKPWLTVILPFIRPFSIPILIAVITIALDALLTAMAPWPLKIIIDRVISNKPTRVPFISAWINTTAIDPQSMVLAACITTLLIAIGTGAFSYLFTRILGTVAQNLVFNIRTHLFSHLQKLSLRFHDSSRLGDTMTRLTSDIDSIQLLVAGGSKLFLSNLMLVISRFSIMMWLNWQFALIACSITPFLFWAVWWHTRKIKAALKTARSEDGELASLAQETLSSIRIVQGLSQEQRQDSKFHIQGRKSQKEYLTRVRHQARLAPIVDFVVAAGLAIVIWYGTMGILKGNLTTGDVIVFFTYVTNFYTPIRSMSRNAGDFSKAAAGAERVAEVLTMECEVKNSPGAVSASNFLGKVEFKNVFFEYKPGNRILEDISLSIQPGEHVAILGKTGAGKSTFASLLMRLYDPVDGSVLIDGKDIRSFTIESLRSQIGLLLQDPFLLSGTISENIAFGCTLATEEQIYAAAVAAYADEFIRLMPDGYNTDVAEHGVSLSGGQRQRIAIARALLRDAPIIILDEPTSSLDIISEASLINTLKACLKGKTTIMITHRLAAAQFAERIIIFDKGKIIEQGAAIALLKNGGIFADLVAANSGGKPLSAAI